MTAQTAKLKTQISPQILWSILEELRLLRSQIMLLLPQEDLEDYAHPERIRSSYQKAVKQYPPFHYGNSQNKRFQPGISKAAQRNSTALH